MVATQTQANPRKPQGGAAPAGRQGGPLGPLGLTLLLVIGLLMVVPNTNAQSFSGPVGTGYTYSQGGTCFTVSGGTLSQTAPQSACGARPTITPTSAATGDWTFSYSYTTQRTSDAFRGGSGFTLYNAGGAITTLYTNWFDATQIAFTANGLCTSGSMPNAVVPAPSLTFTGTFSISYTASTNLVSVQDSLGGSCSRPAAPSFAGLNNFELVRVGDGNDPGPYTRTLSDIQWFFSGVTPPPSSATITAPTETQNLVPPGSQTFTATVVDNTAPPAAPVYLVRFTTNTGASCLDTVAPYTCQINLPAGVYTVTATAETAGGFVVATSAVRNFQVRAIPTYTIATPTAGQNFPNPSNVGFSSTFNDPNGLIEHITYSVHTPTNFNAGTCTANGVGYACTINGLATGTYTIGSAAYDSSGNLLTYDSDTLGSGGSRTFTVGGGGLTLLGATATRAISGGTGFDVDPTGSAIISRQGGGHVVNTYAGGSTMPLLGTTETHCTRSRGVMSVGSHVAYLQCNTATPSVVDSFNIRAPNLGAATRPDVCTSALFSWCRVDIPDASIGGTGALAGNHDNDSHLTGFADFPITYLNNKDGVGSDDAVWMAFGFTTSTGNVGVVSYVMNNQNSANTGELDYSSIVIRNIGTSTPTSLCVVRDAYGPTAGQSFLYASDQASNVHGYRVTFTNNYNAFFKQHQIDAHMEEVFSGTSLTAAPSGLGCGWGKLAIVTPTTLTIWNRGELVPYKTVSIDGSQVYAGAVTMSANGGWVAYGHQAGSFAQVEIYNTTTGNKTIALSSPNSDFVGMGYQGCGATFWYSTTNAIERFNLVGPNRPLALDCSFTQPAPGTGGDTLSSNAAACTGSLCSTSGATGLDINAGDGLCLVCTFVNSPGSILISKNLAFILGFLFVALSVGLSVYLASIRGASLGGPVTGSIVAVGIGGAYLLFLFPLFIVSLAALISGAVILTTRSRAGA